jgi:hypothetical protein
MKTQKAAMPRIPSSHAVGCAGLESALRSRKLGFSTPNEGRMGILVSHRPIPFRLTDVHCQLLHKSHIWLSRPNLPEISR